MLTVVEWCNRRSSSHEPILEIIGYDSSQLETFLQLLEPRTGKWSLVRMNET